jgi:hypothetical protein
MEHSHEVVTGPEQFLRGIESEGGYLRRSKPRPGGRQLDGSKLQLGQHLPIVPWLLCSRRATGRLAGKVGLTSSQSASMLVEVLWRVLGLRTTARTSLVQVNHPSEGDHGECERMA